MIFNEPGEVRPGRVIKWAVKTLYNRLIRQRLPDKWIVSGDITIRSGKLLDLTMTAPREITLRESIKYTVERGDTVVVIGGGYGTSTVESSRNSGESGHVIAYEPVLENVGMLSDTVEHNYTPSIVEINHASVGSVSEQSKTEYGDNSGDIVNPADIPEADVYVLDCEGTEADILPHIQDSRVILEYHEWADIETERLEEMGFEYVALDSEVSSIWIK